MKTIPVGTPVTVTIPFQTAYGEPVVPTALSVRVLDENEAEVVGATSVSFAPGDTEVAVLVSGPNNTLSVGAIKGYRLIELTMTTDDGTVVTSTDYMIATATRLVVMVNSFQTFGMAKMLSSEIPGLVGFSQASEDDQIACLVEAYERLTRLGYYVKWPRDEDQQRYIDLNAVERVAPKRWRVIDADEFELIFPAPFKQAIRKAQIVEANEILVGDAVSDKRRSGLLSESIGESSVFFRTGRPIDLGISRAALEYLTGYIDVRMVTTRV